MACTSDPQLPLPLHLDPSDFRPESKAADDFRVYDASNPRFAIVQNCYREMHTKQTLAYATAQRASWGKMDKARMTVVEALTLLSSVLDASDPDVSVSNIHHAYQTAERIRQSHPDEDWFHLTGLIHDLGKIMAVHGQPQWSTVGDTFPLGCAFSPSIVFHEQFVDNPDSLDPALNTQLGIYQKGCGLDQVTMSWGHDEYMYQVLKANNAKLPEEALAIIRYHSFYPWHTGNAYQYLTNEKDARMLPWIREFNQFDLYSKSDDLPDIAVLTPYYQSLIDKYCPGILSW